MLIPVVSCYSLSSLISTLRNSTGWLSACSEIEPALSIRSPSRINRAASARHLQTTLRSEPNNADAHHYLAMALQMNATIYDLEEAELCYAPQFGSAKDPVNFAGMIAADILRDDMPISHWSTAKDGFLLDVRNPVELVVEHVPGAVNIPLGELRSRLDELPRDEDINVFCRSGQRSYFATRILLQNGFKVRNVSGGMLSRAHNYLLDIKKER